MFNVGAERPKKDCFLRTHLVCEIFVTFLRIKITAYRLIQYKNTETTLTTPVKYYVSQQFIPVTKISILYCYVQIMYNYIIPLVW